MKVIFICGSLEPGRDGVGDYTRRLACALIQNGYEAMALSLNDFFITAETKGYQNVDGIDLPVLRLPAVWQSKMRYSAAKVCIDKFDPFWVSFQFVPFAYHPKGLPFNLNSLIAEIRKGRRLQIMFHELWVGMNAESSAKLKFWGHLQKIIIQRLCRNLKPQIVHTQSQLYLACLKKVKVNAMLLPLFSNVPLHVSDNHGSNHLQTDNDGYKCITIIFFGSIHSGGPIATFADELASCIMQHHLKVEVLFVGRSGSEQIVWKNVLNEKGIEVKSYGEQEANVISELLANATFGISTTPVMLSEKSGTIAAMREHGLPVLCLSHKWTPQNLEFKADIGGVFEYHAGMLESFITNLEYIPVTTNLAFVATSFCQSLNI